MHAVYNDGIMQHSRIHIAGLTSKGGSLGSVDLPAGTVVAIMAEGKTHAVALGELKMSTEEMYVITGSSYLLSLLTFMYNVHHLHHLSLIAPTVHSLSIIFPGQCHSRSLNKGIAIETLHYLNDPLWKNTAPRNAATAAASGSPTKPVKGSGDNDKNDDGDDEE